MKSWWTIPIGTVLLAATMLPASGCGNQDTPTAPSLSKPITDAVVPAADNGLHGFYRMDIGMTRSGRAVVHLQWPNADVSLELYLTEGDCADAANLLTEKCSIKTHSRRGNPPVSVSTSVVTGDTLTVWVVNPDHIPQPITIAIQVE